MVWSGWREENAQGSINLDKAAALSARGRFQPDDLQLLETIVDGLECGSNLISKRALLLGRRGQLDAGGLRPCGRTRQDPDVAVSLRL